VFFDANSGGGGGGSNDNPDGDNKPKGKTFTQEELDTLFAQRATQAKSSALSDFLKELGVENADALKSALKAAKDADDAQKSELQKAQDKAANAEKAANEQKATFEAKIADLEKLLTDTEIKIFASKALKDKDGNVTRAAFRADALEDVVVLINRQGIKRENGAVSGIEEALSELAKAKTFMLDDEPAEKFKGSPTDSKFRKLNKPKLNAEDDEKPFFASL
jgi:hypothetical protein